MAREAGLARHHSSNIRPADDDDALREAVAALAAGQLVGMPT